MTGWQKVEEKVRCGPGLKKTSSSKIGKLVWEAELRLLNGCPCRNTPRIPTHPSTLPDKKPSRTSISESSKVPPRMVRPQNQPRLMTGSNQDRPLTSIEPCLGCSVQGAKSRVFSQRCCPIDFMQFIFSPGSCLFSPGGSVQDLVCSVQDFAVLLS